MQTTLDATTPRSIGHIAFAVSDYDGTTYEFYQVNDQVYKAPLYAAFDVTTDCRIGRWECSVNNWDYIKRVWNIA